MERVLLVEISQILHETRDSYIILISILKFECGVDIIAGI